MTSTQEIKNRAAKLPPVDESVQLPAAIRAAAARSNALHQQAYQVEEPNAVATPQAGTEGQPQTPEPEVKPQPQAGTEGVTPPAKADDWEHKYNSMKGRYDRAETTINGLTQRIGMLEAQLAQPRAPVQQPTPDLQFKPLITDKDKEDFGADFIDVAQRAALEKVNPEIAQLKAELAQLKGTVGSVASQTEKQTQQSIYAQLDKDQPNWRQINRDPKFLAWANLPDPFSGAIRVHMMNDAFNKGDAHRVLAFFKGFLSEEAAPTPAPATPPNPVTPQGNSKVPLEAFAAPGRATTAAATPAPAEKETITRAQISQFYLDVQKGKYRGNDAEKDRLERMIFEAEQDGRIV